MELFKWWAVAALTTGILALASVSIFSEDANESNLFTLPEAVRSPGAQFEVSRLRFLLGREERLDAAQIPSPSPVPEVPDMPDGAEAGRYSDGSAAPPLPEGDGGGLRSCPSGAIEDIVAGYDWPCWEAVAIAGCESGRNAEGFLDGNYAVGAGSYGLFQIQASFHAARFPGFWERWWEVEFNTMMAYTLYVESGRSWGPWSCRWAAYR